MDKDDLYFLILMICGLTLITLGILSGEELVAWISGGIAGVAIAFAIIIQVEKHG